MNEDELRGQLIARLREDQLWTREELSRRAGVTPTTVSQAETGRTHVRLRTIGKLADALGVPAATLLRPAEEKELAAAGKVEAPEKRTGQLELEEQSGASELDIRREAARAFYAINEDFQQELESIKKEGDASKLLRLFRRAAVARIGVNTMVVGWKDSEPLSVPEEEETAAEREVLGKVNGGLRRLEETVEEIWSEYEAVRKRDSVTADDNVVHLPFLRRRAS